MKSPTIPLTLGAAPFLISVIGLAVQGLAGISMYGTAVVAGTDGIPSDVSGWLTVNVTPVSPATLWFLVLASTVGVFVTGLLGVFLLKFAGGRKVRFGALLVSLSAVFAFPVAWGYGLGSLLMLAGSIMTRRAVRRNRMTEVQLP